MCDSLYSKSHVFDEPNYNLIPGIPDKISKRSLFRLNSLLFEKWKSNAVGKRSSEEWNNSRFPTFSYAIGDWKVSLISIDTITCPSVTVPDEISIGLNLTLFIDTSPRTKADYFMGLVSDFVEFDGCVFATFEHKDSPDTTSNCIICFKFPKNFTKVQKIGASGIEKLEFDI